MALKAILEVVLQLDCFRNVDLTQQGLYQVHVRIYSGDEVQVSADPYELINLGYQPKSTCPLPARLDDHTNAMCSSTVLIRYCDEETKLSEACVFRMELGLGSPTVLTLEATLLFNDLNGGLNFDAPMAQLRSLGAAVEFYPVAKTYLKVANPLDGVHQYAQFVFSTPCMCALAISLHTALMDYRFRVTTPISDIELPKAIAKCLFSKEGQVKVFVGSDETDKKYGQLVHVIAHCFDQLRDFVHQILTRCVTSDMLEGFRDLPGPLSLPIYRAPFSSVIPKRFSEAVSSHDPEFVAAALLTEVNMIAGQVCQLFHTVRSLMKMYPGPIMSMLQETYMEAVRERCGESIFRDSHMTPSCPLTADDELSNRHRTQAHTQRKNRYYCHLNPMPVHDPSLFPSPEEHPILFEDNYRNPGADLRPENRPRGLADHVMVLVHGYQGNSLDMRLIRNSLALVYPQTIFLCSSLNEESTEGDILQMGERLAKEVVSFVEEWCPKGKLAKLSFVAHSLGGLIVRAALPHLQSLAGKMHSFVTLSSPHLGYMYTSSKLVDAGMWLLKTWNKSLCLRQLSMSEERDPYQTVLYRLSGYLGLNWFKHVVLISSYQDQYAPFESARVEVSPRAATDPMSGKAYIEMADRILGTLAPTQLCRLDVSFKISGKSIDSLIGRTAHIQFLENEGFLRVLAFRYPDFFR